MQKIIDSAQVSMDGSSKRLAGRGRIQPRVSSSAVG